MVVSIKSTKAVVCLTCIFGAPLSLLAACGSDQPAFEGCSTDNLDRCEVSPGYANPYEGQLFLLSWEDTLRKVSLEVNGTLPNEEQRAATDEHGQLGFEASLFEMMREEAFFVRVKELFNDHFLTDKYIGGENALSLLSEEQFPNAYWHESFSGGDREFGERVNDSVAREALELIAHVVRENKSFQEILTADYTMANGYSAPSLIGQKNIPFDVPDDREKFRKVRVPGIPHAGILSSPMFLNRFPTSDTNRNRHRARKAYEFFLDSDIQALGDRPIDANLVDAQTPTLSDPSCTQCHSVMDPMAGAFRNWDERGTYHKNRDWHEDMRAPGFGGELIEEGDAPRSLQWLAKRIVIHPRFSRAIVRMVFHGLTGQMPLKTPSLDSSTSTVGLSEDGTVDSDFASYQRAYEVQQGILETVRQRFIDSDFNFKLLVREVVLTPYFRAGSSVPLDDSLAAEMHAFGTARLLTPEQLSRKIRATTGVSWRPRPGQRDHLLDAYRLFYGGIDSDLVIKRITDPNGVISSVAQRMSLEVACKAVPADLSKGVDDRTLIPFVDPGIDPRQQEGALREAIAYMHSRLLGERLPLDHEEINETVDLYFAALDAGRQDLESGAVTVELPDPCRYRRDLDSDEQLPENQRLIDDPGYSVRAFMAVGSYLMSDYRFLFDS